MKSYRKPLSQGGVGAVFEFVFHHTHTFIGLLDPAGTLLELNRPALELLGLGRDEAVGRPVWAFPAWPQGTRPAVQNAVRNAARGDFVRFETELVGAAGRWTVIDFSVRPVVDPEGQIVFLVAEGRDVTEEHDQQARYRAILDVLHEGIVQQEREGDITAYNGAAERILGLSREQMLGLSSIDPRWHTVHEDGLPDRRAPGEGRAPHRRGAARTGHGRL